MDFANIFKKEPFIYLNNQKTSELLDQYFKENGPVSMQSLWLNMIKKFLKKNKPVVSVPYKGMILVISKEGEFLKSSKFKEVMNESLESKEGKDKLTNFFIIPEDNPVLANDPKTISNKFPDWLPKESRGEYLFMITMNISRVSRHIKKIIENKIKANIKEKNNFIIYDNKKAIDVYDIIKNWLLCGVTLEVLEPLIQFYIKSNSKNEVAYKTKKQACEKRIKNFSD